MTKTDNRPIEKKKLVIEFADNGIILRNPDCENDVHLAMNGLATHGLNSNGYAIDHSQEYQAIGKYIYNWLTNVAITEHCDYWVTTGAVLDIKATLMGREL